MAALVSKLSKLSCNPYMFYRDLIWYSIICTDPLNIMSRTIDPLKEFRPNTEVLARIAEAFLQNNSIKKTHLHFASRTDWNSFEKYLSWLQEKNYITYLGVNDRVYRLSDSGRIMFNSILNLRDNIKQIQSIINV